MGVPPVRIEILTSISGVDFGKCYSRRCRADFAGVAANLIDLNNLNDLNDLKKNKNATGRLKDRLDLQELS